MSNRSRFKPLALAGVLATLFGLTGGTDVVPSSDLAAEAARLQQENAQLERLLELASGEEPYLILDLRVGSLQLGLAGAKLAEYEIQSVEIGTPSVLFVKREPSAGWHSRVWNGAELTPRRQKKRHVIEASRIDLDDPSYDPPIPLTPEQAVPVPRRFLLRFEQGLVVECVADDDGEPGLERNPVWLSGIANWLRDAVDAARPSGVPRLRLHLRSTDAAALYRGVPEGTRLLVLRGASEPGSLR